MLLRKKMKKVKTKYSVLMAGVLGMTSPFLNAQVIEEIIVTAQKRAESIQDVPISIAAFTGDVLENQGIQVIQDVADLTPNFSINTTTLLSGNTVSIRSLGTSATSALESSVGVFIDGVYYSRTSSLLGLLSDVETFEVLRGPQGTLFGRNTLVGALNISTRKPTDVQEGSIQAGFGDYESYEIGGFYNQPLTDNINSRIVFKYTERDGYGKNDFDGKTIGDRDDLIARAKVNFDFNDDLSLLVSADYGRINAGGNVIEVLNSTSTPSFEAASTPTSPSTADGSDFGSGPATTSDSFDFRVNQQNIDDHDDEQYGISFDVNYLLDSGINLRSITSFRNWMSDADESVLRIPGDVSSRFSDYESDTFSQEIQLLSPGGETVDWVAGLYYYQEDYDINRQSSFGNDFCNFLVPAVAAATCLAGVAADPIFADTAFTQELSSYAVFGQAEWHVDDQLSFTLGARWTQEDRDGDFNQQRVGPLAGFGVSFRANDPAPNLKFDDEKFTWLFNTQYSLTSDVLLFATVSTGYKSGGFNTDGTTDVLGEDQRTLRAETSDNYELGIKGTFWDGRLTANATLFRTDIEDFQDSLVVGGLSQIVINAGTMRLEGIETDLLWQPIDPLNIVARFAYLDARYRNFDDAPGLPDPTLPIGTVNSQDLSGETKRNAPEWQSSISADWTGDINDNLEWFMGATWQFLDDHYLGSSTDNNPQADQHAYNLFNGRVGFRSATGSWDVTLFGENLTNQGYCQTMFDQPVGTLFGAQAVGTSVQRCVLDEPRTWSLKGRYNF